MILPRIVDTVLSEYITLLNQHFPGIVEGLYLHGSIALDAYVENSSDIDFITITNHRLTEEDSEALSNIHSSIAEKYKKPEMDGVYMSWDDLGKLYSRPCDFNNKYQFYNDGKLDFGDYYNFNPVTWWILKNKGISIIGKDSKNLDFEIQPRELISYVHNNMNTYWVNYIQHIETQLGNIIKLPTKKIDNEIEWTVLGLLRQFYTLKECDIVSKSGAGEYGLFNLPVEWHRIIREAVNIRSGVNEKIFDSERERVENTLRFSKFLIRYCNS